MSFRLLLIVTLLLSANTRMLTAAEPYQPFIEKASDEGFSALQSFAIPEFLKGTLVAAEPELANPIAFCFDEQGHIYVAETFRQTKGIEDNRGHMYWLMDDLQAQTVADREAYIRKHHADRIDHYTKEHDRIRLLKDTDGDGTYETATVFADGFNEIVTGSGAGLLATGNTVYYTCIPDLWKLTDDDGDGKADQRERLHTGYGVRFAFRGHDMHGLTWGPDGRIYYSIGDRGYNVISQEGTHLAKPETGAVFRCWPDGSGLEVFAYGFRNPQELAFDDYGNLFTGDNNSDGGDQARWVYVCEGMDAGWRMYYQYKDGRGPWNQERMWYPYQSDETTTAVQPAYIVPPILNISDGPSGVSYYPGWGLPDRYQNHFFLVDFRGSASNSGVRSFAMKPKGAGFELVDAHEFLWSILATDVDFGFDGRVYATDWVSGWNGVGKGRIYAFGEKGKHKELADEVTRLMAGDWSQLDVTQLTELLAHTDRRVRMKSQFELAARQDVDAFAKALTSNDHQLSRIHAIWGLGQIARTDNSALNVLSKVLNDSDPEIVAQAISVIGDAETDSNTFADRLISLVKHDSDRVKYHAAITLGKLKIASAFDLIREMVAENGTDDAFLRHAGVMGLLGCGNQSQLVALKSDESRDVRVAAVVALRRLKSPKISTFLEDEDPSVVMEAARAINDVPIAECWNDLAKLSLENGHPDALNRRILNANYRLGDQEHAKKVIQFATSEDCPLALRMEALEQLTQWRNPAELDRVTHDWQPLPQDRNVEFLAEMLRPMMKPLFQSHPDIRNLALELVSQYQIPDLEIPLREIVKDTTQSEANRRKALLTLGDVQADNLEPLLKDMLNDSSEGLRSASRRLMIQRQPESVPQIMEPVFQSGSLREQQDAIKSLAIVNNNAAQELLLSLFQRMTNGSLHPGIQLDLLNAAQQIGTDAFLAAVTKYEAARDPVDELSGYRETLHGGDPNLGRDVFFGSATASCRRCHKINNNGGGVGPDLSTIGKDKPREYLLESIVLPNKAIAKGFDTVMLVLASGKIVSGILKEETDDTITLVKPLGEVVVIDQDDIDDRAIGKSGMPTDLKKTLTKSEIRDLVAYLATLRTKSKQASKGHEGE